MNEQAKPTMGEWSVREPNRSLTAYCGVGGGEDGYIIADLCNDGYSEAIQRANAALIAEAGTVYHETGLTPRQLAEQRKELMSALMYLAADYAVFCGAGLTSATEPAVLAHAKTALAHARGEKQS